jgi:hypothetical protein
MEFDSRSVRILLTFCEKRRKGERREGRRKEERKEGRKKEERKEKVDEDPSGKGTAHSVRIFIKK